MSIFSLILRLSFIYDRIDVAQQVEHVISSMEGWWFESWHANKLLGKIPNPEVLIEVKQSALNESSSAYHFSLSLCCD